MATLFKQATRNDLLTGYSWLLTALDNGPTKKIPNYASLQQAYADMKKTKKYDSKDTKIVFIEKPVEDLSLKELKALLLLDLKHEDVKFRFTTNNHDVPEKKYRGNFTRLFTNEINNRCHLNRPELTDALFKNTFTEYETKVEQTYLVEQDSSSGTKYLEVANRSHFKIPLHIADTEYTMSVPSLSLAPKIEAIGVPSNHPDIDRIRSAFETTGLKTPFSGGDVQFYELPPSYSEDLTAIIPTHILEHQEFRRAMYAEPGPVRDGRRSQDHRKVSSQIARNLNITVPLFFSIPYISNVKYLNGQRVTLVQDDGEILDPAKFYKIETTVEARKYDYKPEGTSISQVPKKAISSWLGFGKKEPRWKYYNADTLRATLLSGNTISTHLLTDKGLVLEFLTKPFEYLKAQSVQYVPREKLSSLIKTPYDQDIVKSYYDFKTGEEHHGLGEFARDLSNYLLYLQTARLENNELLFNIAHRLLNNELRYLFVEFTNYYTEMLNIKRSTLQYPNEAIQATHYSHIPELIAKVHSIVEFKAPYTQHLLMRSPFPTSVKANLELIKRICKEKGVELHFELPQNIKHYGKLYHQEETKLALFRYKTFKPEEWRAKLEEMRFLKQHPDLTGDEVVKQLRRDLLEDMNLDVSKLGLAKEQREHETDKLTSFIHMMIDRHINEEFLKTL